MTGKLILPDHKEAWRRVILGSGAEQWGFG